MQAWAPQTEMVRTLQSKTDQEEVARIHGITKQKGLNDLDNYDDVVTHLEPDILKCEVKWTQEASL